MRYRTTDRPAERVCLWYGILVFVTIFLQKTGLPTGDYLGTPVIFLIVALVMLTFAGTLRVDQWRLVWFALMVCTAMVSLIIERQLKSYLSLLLVFMMYGLLVFRIDVDKPTMLRCFRKLQTAITMIAFIVIIQQLVQYTVGHGFWPNLDTIIPGLFLVKGYAYLRPYSWGSPYLTPNGIFFLEPSGLSWLTAIALAMEIVWFKRIWLVILFAMALLACMAVTGILVTAPLSPFLLRKMDPRLNRWSIALALLVIVATTMTGSLSQLSERSGEISDPNSSGYARIVVPFEQTIALAMDPSYLLSGNSPGTSPKEHDVVQWPSNKLIYEYGLLTAVIFHVFLIYSILRSSPSPVVAMVILIPHLIFGGGFLSAPSIAILALFGTLLRVNPESVPQPTLARLSLLTVDSRDFLAPRRG